MREKKKKYKHNITPNFFLYKSSSLWKKGLVSIKFNLKYFVANSKYAKDFILPTRVRFVDTNYMQVNN